MNVADLRIRPLEGPFGAEVLGVDARENIPEEIRRQLREAWHRHALLLFRGQELTSEQQIAFASIFGAIEDNEQETHYNFVSNVTESGLNPVGPLGFHCDHSMHPNLLRGLMLYGIEIPPEGSGGETLFADVRAAYRSLPEGLRAKIGGLTIRHGQPDRSKGLAVPGLNPDPKAPRFARPLVFPHPVTGTPILFLSRRHADCILEVSAAESAALIDALAAYINRPESIQRHAWRPGDLVLWDNIALQHGRTDFDRNLRRHIRRVMIGPPET